MQDTARPLTQPAGLLYDAFQEEAARWGLGRAMEEWATAEKEAVWAAARNYSQQHGLRVLTLAEIRIAGEPFRGRADYGAKWAYGIAEMLRKLPRLPTSR